jgi:repressor LexA
MDLTRRQSEVLDYILAFRRQNGCSPSIPEIQRKFGFRSPNGVAGHLNALQSKGYIRRTARGSRMIDVVGQTAPESRQLHDLPLFGSIPAGTPQAAGSTGAESAGTFDEQLLGFKPKPGCFVLKVRGESMRGAGILDGDMVVVEPTPSPRANQIVAALIDGESTLKRLVLMKGRWYLKAENPDFPELHPREDLVIQGTVRAVIRRLA